MLCGCSPATSDGMRDGFVASPQLDRALNIALSWPAPARIDVLTGAKLLQDGPPASYPEIAITRAILRTNPRIVPAAALVLAFATTSAARENGLPGEFLAATILQESAYDPNAISSAGAVGIAQFTLETADGEGVDPYDPYDAVAGAGRLIGSYVRRYRPRFSDPYAVALAAYNAGPGAVARYGGVPPYAETKAYVDDIYERWARIASYEVLPADFHKGRLKRRP